MIDSSEPPTASSDQRGTPMLVARSLTFSYGRDSVLSGVDFSVDAGESVAVVGASGSGKSSLLYCLSGVLRPSGGSVTFRGKVVSAMSASDRAQVRRRHFGFVFQFGELVPELTVRENVELPLRLGGVARREARRRTDSLLEQLGISQVGGRLPAQTSGGQAQRAAVARAVIHRPDVVFADEPTGALDSASGELVIGELLALCREAGSGLVLVTHDDSLAETLDRSVRIADGRCAVATE